MAPITIEQFPRAVSGWGRERSAGFRRNYPVNGGWEGWCQVDLVAWMLQQDPTADILREQPDIVAPRGRVDLLLNSQQPPAGRVIVEMKAESFYNRQNFVAGVEADVRKLANQRVPAWQTVPCAVLAIAFSQGAVRGVLEIVEGIRIFSQFFIEAGRESTMLMTRWDARNGWRPV